jgi:hypothetical protein
MSAPFDLAARVTAAAALACLAPALAPPILAQEILVSGFDSGVHRYDFATGTFLGMVGDVDDPLGIVHGPDGNVYVAEEATDRVLRFDGVTLQLIDAFVADDPQTPEDENGPLNAPTGVLFGADGDLYVASFNNDRVLRYDGTTGAFVGTLVSAGSGGLDGPDAGMAWGPDGHLYVPSFFNHSVLRYDEETGASLGAFVPSGQGGLINPRTVVFRQDGTALVSGEGSNNVHHYDDQGNFLGLFLPTGLNNATALAVSPLDGDLYASNLNADNVRRFNGTNGTQEGIAVNPGEGGLDGPVFLAFHPDPYLRLGRVVPGTTNAFNVIRVEGATPFAFQTWMIGTSLGSTPFTSCPHLFLGIQAPKLKITTADAEGTSSIGTSVGENLAGVTLLFQVLERVSCRASNLVIQTIVAG